MLETATLDRTTRRETLLVVVSSALLTLLYLRTLGRPSLWLDEAWEANAYLGIGELWYNRPVLYMAAETLMVRLFGPSEFVLRLLPWLEMGWAVANIEYRLGEVSLAPAAVEDCLCALRWVIRNAEDYNGRDAPISNDIWPGAESTRRWRTTPSPVSFGSDTPCPRSTLS